MKHRTAIRIVALLVVTGSCAVRAARAELPRFLGPIAVLDNGVPIDVGEVSAPLMFDWNRDGRKDLLCGQYDSGKIRFYQNLGSDSAPVFSGYQFLRADSADITFPSI